MNFEKPKISIKSNKSNPPKTIKDIEDTLKEMDKIYNTTFYNWIKDENNASVIALKTKDLFHEYYEKQPELVYNVLRFLCKDWKLSKIAELILKLFYKNNIASETLAIIIYEVSLLLENPEKVDLISLLLIGEEPKNVAFFLYHFYIYTEKKYREHTEIINEEDFLDEMNAFCSGVLECLYSCLKWNNDYFRELILEYISLSTLEIDARREFLVRMVNVKYTRFQQELLIRAEGLAPNTKSNSIPRKNSLEKIEENEEVFKRSLNFGILIFNMYQVVMRTEVDELLAVTSPTTKEAPSNNELSRDQTVVMSDINNNEFNDDSIDFSSGSKRISLKGGDDDYITNNHEEEHMKKEESSATLWMDDENNKNDLSSDENYNSEMSVSIYNFGYDSSFCKNDSIITEQEEQASSLNSNDSFHINELLYDNIITDNDEEVEDDNTTEIDLLDDFINKSFTSNPSNRRNSILSHCSILNDYNLDDGDNVKNVNTTSSNRRRCSLNLSIHTTPCLSHNGNDDNSNTDYCRYNNYSDNLLHVFPSPASSPALLTPPISPTFHLNDYEFDLSENTTTSVKCCPSPEIGEDYHYNNRLINLSDSSCQPSPTISTTSNNLYHQISPEYISPSPIVRSLSVDHICANPYGYTCTFNHIDSVPSLQQQNAQTVSNQSNRKN